MAPKDAEAAPCAMASQSLSKSVPLTAAPAVQKMDPQASARATEAEAAQNWAHAEVPGGEGLWVLNPIELCAGSQCRR